MSDQNFKVAILSIYGFPSGGAATNRILAYSKGLVENGISVDIFIPTPTDNLPSNILLPDAGQDSGINFYYTSGRYRSKYKIIRGISIFTRYRKIHGYLTSYLKIIKISKSRKYSTLIISTDQILSLYIYSNLANRINAKSVFIFDEFPIPIRHKLKTTIPFWKSFLYRKVLLKINAYISISEELSRYFNNFSEKPTLILPVITDVSKYQNLVQSSAKNEFQKYMCYMGNMELSKDNVDDIIIAFNLIAKQNPELELHLYGSPKIQTRKKLEYLIRKLGLEKKVIFKGWVNTNEVPNILSNAYILVSSQPNTKRASGGFPTKLGEYLAAGTPTILTNVGENAKYVNDGEHVFFVKPHQPRNYANKLQSIIDNYENAMKIAKTGREFLFSNYSHNIQGKRLAEFIKNI